MGSHNHYSGEGASINRPPTFNGEGYPYWKERMKIFIEAIDMDVWDAIENGPFVPQHTVDGEVKDKPRVSWTDDDKKKVQYNLKAKNLITSALSLDEFYRVSQCKNAQEMWETLQVTHEGTSEVKRARMNTLTHEYELFRMKNAESINDMQKRFTHIVNHLKGLGKVFSNEDLINKVLRCLSRSWQPKVTAIAESRDLSTISLATLFGKLQEHELELNRLHENEEMDKKKKGIALKASTSRSASVENDDTSSTSNGSDQDDDELGLFVKRFGKFMKRNNKGKKSFPKRNGGFIKKGDSKSTPLTCFECGKPGHMKFECPTHQKKNEKGEKKGKFERKPRRAYVAWEDNDSGSSSSSDEEESAKLCLMAQDDESSSEVSISSNNSNNPTYDDLYNGFIELHEETKKLTLISIERKRTILAMEKQMLNLQKKYDELKLESETLNLIYTNSSCDCSNAKPNLLPCEYCKDLQVENKDLWKTLAKFTKGRDNLNALLGKQTCTFQKAGLGYNPNKKKKAFKNFFSNNRPTSSPFAFCTYCGKRGHFAYACSIRNYGVPSGKYIWVPKEEGTKANPKGSNKNWIPMTHK